MDEASDDPTELVDFLDDFYVLLMEDIGLGLDLEELGLSIVRLCPDLVAPLEQLAHLFVGVLSLLGIFVDEFNELLEIVLRTVQFTLEL